MNFDPEANETNMQMTMYVSSRRGTTILYRYGYATGNVEAQGKVNRWKGVKAKDQQPESVDDVLSCFAAYHEHEYDLGL